MNIFYKEPEDLRGKNKISHEVILTGTKIKLWKYTGGGKKSHSQPVYKWQGPTYNAVSKYLYYKRP